MTESEAPAQGVVVTGRGCAGWWGVSSEPPATRPAPGSLEPVVPRSFGFRPFAVAPADAAALSASPPGLSRRQQRYLARNSRLALAAGLRAVAESGLSAEPALREPMACLVASTRGPTDPDTTLAMIRAAGGDGPAGRRPSLRAAREEYNRRRLQVQYLLSMETAVTGHVTAALGARGPAHAFTAPGLAGGAQALARAWLVVARGLAPAALVCGVLTAEDEPGVAALLDLLGHGSRREASECAAAVLLERAGDAARSGRRPLRHIEILEERSGGEGAPALGTATAGQPGGATATTIDEDRVAPCAGAALPLLATSTACGEPGNAILSLRGALGHRLVLSIRPAGART